MLLSHLEVFVGRFTHVVAGHGNNLIVQIELN